VKRGWFLLLALSVGLNAGLLYEEFQDAHSHSRRESRSYKTVSHNEQDIIRRRMEQLDDLGLSSDQKARLEGVLNEFVPRIASANREYERLRDEIARESAGESVDVVRLRGLLSDLNTSHATRDSLSAESLQREAEVLDAEQLRSFTHMMTRGGWGSRDDAHGDRRRKR